MSLRLNSVHFISRFTAVVFKTDERFVLFFIKAALDFDNCVDFRKTCGNFFARCVS